MSDTQTAKFDRILDLDQAAQTHHALAKFGSDAATRERGARNFKTAQAAFIAALDTITEDEQAAFLAHRKAQRNLTR